MVAIHIENVSKRFPTPGGHGAVTAAVDGITLTINSGDLFFLLGPSGCGKTTLLRMIAGFTLPTEGHIDFDGEDMTYVPPYKRETGMVFQSYALWPHMTIASNVGFGLDVRKIKGAEQTRRVNEALEMVQMAHLRDRKPNQLSGGQQQRVALARALAIRPKCLLLDEPLSNLDAKLRLEMRAEIRRIVKQTGITAIYVTHDQKEALSMADGIAVMKSGKLQQTGSPTDLYKHPTTRFVADFIGESNFLPATVESVNPSMITLKTSVGPMLAATSAQKKSVTAQQKVLAAFRPEAIALNGGGPLSNRIDGRRISTTYLGEMAEHLVELGGESAGGEGQRVKAFEMNPRNVRPSAGGEPITLYVNAADVTLVEE